MKLGIKPSLYAPLWLTVDQSMAGVLFLGDVSNDARITNVIGHISQEQLVRSIGTVIRRAFDSLEIRVDENADLRAADIEILERAFITIGEELQRRKAL